jgi:GTP cyclohydrolase II
LRIIPVNLLITRPLRCHMRGGGLGEAFEVVAAFEHRNDAALRVFSGDLHQPRGRPGLGAQILRDLGISSIRLRTGRPMTYVGLSGFGIEITASEGLE